MATERKLQLEVKGISKSYAGVQALLDVSLTVATGEVHALVGENGAGKSTLGKIIAGAAQADQGEMRVNGQQISFRNPREGLAGGIALVRQEITLVPSLSVLDNVFLGTERATAGVVRLRPQRSRFRALAEDTGFDLDPTAKVSTLRVGDQQKVEILRAIVRDAWLIVMDEPTAALDDQESARFVEFVRHLRDRGIGFLYISHDLEEVISLADDVTVLKDGRHVSTSKATEVEVGGLVTKMLGRPLTAMFPPKRRHDFAQAPVVLKLDRLTRAGAFEDVSFEVRAGEIVGMAGLVGSGRTDVARAIFGADPSDAGTVELNGTPCRLRSPHQAVRKGIALVPESRKDQGLVMTASVADNLALPSMGTMTVFGVVQRRKQRAAASRIADAVDIRMDSASMPVSLLSGGNQQKAAIGKWLVRTPTVLIADEPTRGVDIGARFTIYQLIQRLADDGLAVVVISSELEEVMGLADRIIVMHRGRVAAELPGDAQEDHILSVAFGREHLTPTVDL
jgi:simple sugar transport system ATP-binding protein/ribose transport system ATP-binding protein